MVNLAEKIFKKYGKEQVLFLLFITLSLIVFFPTLFGIPFWDDWVFVFRNGYFYNQSFLTYFPGGSQSRSWPVFYTFIWFMLKIFGEEYYFFHFASLVIHGINGFLFWKIINKLKIKYPIWIALLFLIHPLQLFTVAWIIQLKTTLSIFFFFLSLWYLVKFYEYEKYIYFLAAIILYAISLFAKSTPVFFVFMFPFLYRPFKNKFGLKKLLLLSTPVLILVILVIIRTAWSFHFQEYASLLGVQSSPVSSVKDSYQFHNPVVLNDDLAPLEKGLISLKNLVRYSIFTIAPIDNHLFPNKTLLEMDSVEFIFIFIGLSLLIYLLFDLFKEKNKTPLAGFLFYLISILPLCGLIFIPIFHFTNFVPYWLSLPFAGLLIAIQYYINNKTWLVLAVVIYGCISHYQSYQFLAPEQFFMEQIKENPDNRIFYVGLVEHYLYLSDCTNAQKTLELLPQEVQQSEFALLTKIHRCQSGEATNSYH